MVLCAIWELCDVVLGLWVVPFCTFFRWDVVELDGEGRPRRYLVFTSARFKRYLRDITPLIGVYSGTVCGVS